MSKPSPYAYDMYCTSDTKKGRLSPAAKRARRVLVRQLANECVAPGLAVRRVPTVYDRAPQLAYVRRGAREARVPARDQCMARQRVFRERELARGDERERRLATGRRRARTVGGGGRDYSEGLQRNVLVWWPCFGRVPLQPTFQERHGERAVVPIQHHIQRSEEPKGGSGVVRELIRNDAFPKGIKRCGIIDRVACVGCQVEVVEGQSVAVPEEVEDTRA